MQAPLFLLVYFMLLTTVVNHPQEVATLIAGLLLVKLLRHC